MGIERSQPRGLRAAGAREPTSGSPVRTRSAGLLLLVLAAGCAGGGPHVSGPAPTSPHAAHVKPKDRTSMSDPIREHPP